jgi:hypothetical protein
VVANGGCAGQNAFIGETGLPGTATYTLELVPSNNDLGSVTLALSADGANGTIKVNGSAVTFTSSHTGQGRNFAFTGKARQVITVSASKGSFPGGCDVTMELVDSVGNVLGNGGCAGSSTFIGETTLPSAGSYLIELIPTGGDPGANVGSLKLNVSADPANGSITANGAAVTFTATHTGQGQNFSLTGQAGQVVTVTTSNGSFPGGCDLTLLLVDSSGNTLGNGGCAASNTFIGETTLPGAGTYTLKLLPTGGDAGNNTGHLTLNLSADPASSTITPDGPAVTFTSTHTGQGQNFTFSGAANEVVSLTASNGTFPSGCDLTMLIVSPSGSTVANGGCSAKTSTITGAVLPGTGMYAVELLPTGSDPGNNTGSVTLKLTTGSHRSR